MKNFHAQRAHSMIGGASGFALGAYPNACTAPCATALGPQAISTHDDATTRDRLLQISRRIDWRFLLPDSRLRRVALLGDDDQELVVALREFSEALSLLDLGWTFPEGQEPLYDTVVLRSTRCSAVRKARSHLEVGGSLYWEIEHRGHLQAARRGALGALRRALGFGRAERPGPQLKAFLESLGFRDVQMYWHQPNFRACLEMIPLESDSTLDYVFRTRSKTTKGRVQQLLGQMLRRCGLLSSLVPSLSIVARYDGEESGGS